MCVGYYCIRHWRYNNEQDKCKACSLEAHSPVAQTDVNRTVTPGCDEYWEGETHELICNR